ncbi:MAG: hypothetical protein WBF90_35925 [Rivularia sp. (in: cyanobacteria)]
MKAKYQRFRNVLFEAGVKPTNLAFGGLLLVSLLLSIPSLQKWRTRNNLIRTEIKQRESLVAELERQVSFEKRQALVANKRYKACLPVVGSQFQNGTHYFTGIKEGDKPKDKITGKNLPSGTIVCDAHGNTGVVGKNGAITYLAYTGDRNIIQSRLKRFRGSQYSQPVIPNNQ